MFTSTFTAAAATSGALEAASNAPAKSPDLLPNFVRINTKYTYEVTNPYLNTSNKMLTILKSRQNGSVMDQSIYLGGYGLANAMYIKSNQAGQAWWNFDMRGKKKASNIQVDSALLGFTGNAAPWATFYAELTYNGHIEQEVYASQAFAVLGNLSQMPVYLSIGASYVPFGKFQSLSGTYTPLIGQYFTPLCQNVTAGFTMDGFGVTVSAARGGLNKHDDVTWNMGSSLRMDKSQINQFLATVSYANTYSNGDYYVGLGWNNQSPFDVMNTSGSPDATQWDFGRTNPAWDLNAGVTFENFSLRGEYVSTRKNWQALAYSPRKVRGYDVQASYDFNFVEYDHRIALGYGRLDLTKAQALKNSKMFTASLVSSVHENLSLYWEYQYNKGAQIQAPWMAVANEVDFMGATAANIKTNTVMLGARAAF